MEKGIRSIELSDAYGVQELYAPFVTDSATSFELDAPTVATMEQRIKAVRNQYPWLVFERDGNVLGYAYASTHH